MSFPKPSVLADIYSRLTITLVKCIAYLAVNEPNWSIVLIRYNPLRGENNGINCADIDIWDSSRDNDQSLVVFVSLNSKELLSNGPYASYIGLSIIKIFGTEFIISHAL